MNDLAPEEEAAPPTIVLDYRDPTRVLAHGATVHNGAPDILASLGWHWLQSAQAYSVVTSNPVGAVERTTTVLRATGYTVRLMAPEAGQVTTPADDDFDPEDPVSCEARHPQNRRECDLNYGHDGMHVNYYRQLAWEAGQ